MQIRLGNLGGTIMCGDRPILRFKFVRDQLSDIEIYDVNTRPVPFEFSFDKKIGEQEIRDFFDARITPDTRIRINELLAKTPVKYYDPERIIRYNSGKCIHDPFWVDCDDDKTCWKA